MKKFFFLAAIALVASAACTKNEVKSVNDQAIAFTVGNYVPQTKTDLPAAVKFEEYTSFTTDAWFHPADGGAAQTFMSGETVSMDATTGVWAPARTYFWPKTGSINFYSQAGTPVATISDTAGSESATYGSSSTTTPQAIAITDNAVLASAAFHYSRANWENNTYPFTYGTSGTDVKGVPTLFHHMLAKVSFIVKFDATAGSNKDKWTLHINSAKLNYADNGYLTVNFATNKPAAGTAGISWPWTANEEIGWTPDTTNVTTPGLAHLAAPATGNSTAASVADQTQAGVDGTTASVSEGVTIFNEISVLPQDLCIYAAGTHPTGTHASLSLNYTLTHYYKTGTSGTDADWTQQIVETVNLTSAADAAGNPALGDIFLTKFTSSDYDAWYMNHKYVYTVTIKPDHSITFSPAVVPWVTGNSTGYTYPED